MWIRLKTNKLLVHPRLQVVEDDVRIPSGEIIQYLRYKNTTDGVCIICVRNDKVLVQQEYSYPPNQVLFQFPGGAIEKGETADAAARRELLEESGYVVSSLKELGFFYTNNRRSDSKMYVYLAADGDTSSTTNQDKEEDIASKWIPIYKLQEMIATGKVTNFSLLASWALFQAQK